MCVLPLNHVIDDLWPPFPTLVAVAWNLITYQLSTVSVEWITNIRLDGSTRLLQIGEFRRKVNIAATPTVHSVM
jgi:hypothetical protein